MVSGQDHRESRSFSSSVSYTGVPVMSVGTAHWARAKSQKSRMTGAANEVLELF